jgi:hypothetical protein
MPRGRHFPAPLFHLGHLLVVTKMPKLLCMPFPLASVPSKRASSPRGTGVKFADLPPELIDLIIQHLGLMCAHSDHYGRKFASLVLVSKLFYAQMSRHPYLRMQLCPCEPDEIEKWSMCMASSPDLAARVLSLRIQERVVPEVDHVERRARRARSIWLATAADQSALGRGLRALTKLKE